jgi:NAD+ diphosphatase
MERRFIPGTDASPRKNGQAWWFIFKNHKVLVLEDGEEVSIPCISDPSEMGLACPRPRYMGELDGRGCYCAETSADSPLEGAAFRGLRYLYGRLEECMHSLAMRAVHLVEWDKNEQFCGRCGARTEDKAGQNAKECPLCGSITFPRISPAVIVLVEREGKVLLARATRFTEEIYSVLAGFVEPGETLEETVQREIEEEVGISVSNVRYFGSQPWPFPDSLMIGFTAKYESGEIRIDDSEIAAAGWFEPDGLPRIPGRISIARKLIDWFVEGSRKGAQAAGPKFEKKYGPNE